MIKSIEDFNLENKKVIIRCDFNVPISNGVITNDNRIKMSIRTINYAIKNNAKIILMSHLRKIKTEEDKVLNNLGIIIPKLEELLNKKVYFSNETRGNNLENLINNLKNGDVLLIQNTRYEDLENKKESKNDEKLGKYWASLGDIFINDAFGTAHRSHASNCGISSYLPSGIGYLIKKELDILMPAIDMPKRPFTVILGGSKVSDKLQVIKNLVTKADYILIGGAMANTFLKANNINVGISKIEKDNNKTNGEFIDYIEFCKNIYKENKNKIILPSDAVVSKEFKDIKGIEKQINSLNDDDMILDIGENTINEFEKIINISKQIIWNGPLGVSEFENYSNGTKSICEILSKNKGITIIGGGDSAGAAINFGYKDKFTHISTGGGASLTLLEGKTLPAIEILKN